VNDVQITLTATDRQWLRRARDIAKGKPASPLVKAGVVRELSRLLFRAEKGASG
jgi:hypothetical protein